MRRFDRLQAGVRYITDSGAATPAFQSYWQKFCEQLEAALDGLEGAIAAVAAAQSAADAANVAADAATSAAVTAQSAADNAASATAAAAAELSLNNSYVSNFVAPLVSADSAGNVTIANHDRVYGDSTLNPTVAVTGGVIATGQANPAVVYIFYVQPSRAGGAVTLQWSLNSPSQTGDTHSVGSVQIPAAGTANGGYVRPPGYSRFDEVEP